MQTFIKQIQSNQPIFQVETVLSAPEIVLLPPAGELYKLLLQMVRDTVERYNASLVFISLELVFY